MLQYLQGRSFRRRPLWFARQPLFCKAVFTLTFEKGATTLSPKVTTCMLWLKILRTHTKYFCSIALFFVWIWKPEFYSIAVYQVYLVEISLYSAALASVIVAGVQLRYLKFDSEQSSRLDDALLVIPQMGVYIFPMFILISGRHSIFKDPKREDIAGMLSAILEIIQSTLQTMFLLDALRRRPFRQKHVEKKPGRQLVTFLIVCNFSLWAIAVMEAWRQQMYPQQLQFYGTFAVIHWTSNFLFGIC